MTGGLPQVIAIDGPAASGKSSVARLLARRLGTGYVNTGMMYRAATWYLLERGIVVSDPAAVADGIRAAAITCGFTADEAWIRLDGLDPAPHLSEERVNGGVSLVARVPEVRRTLVALQQALAAERTVVMEGRDIGTVVSPGSPWKFYIDATPEVRARRRAAQGFADEIAARDRVDSTRKDSPLAVAADARVIDTSHLTLEEVVDAVEAALRSAGFPFEHAPA
jgi:cytidylate kinase